MRRESVIGELLEDPTAPVSPDEAAPEALLDEVHRRGRSGTYLQFESRHSERRSGVESGPQASNGSAGLGPPWNW